MSRILCEKGFGLVLFPHRISVLIFVTVVIFNNRDFISNKYPNHRFLDSFSTMLLYSDKASEL